MGSRCLVIGLRVSFRTWEGTDGPDRRSAASLGTLDYVMYTRRIMAPTGNYAVGKQLVLHSCREAQLPAVA